LEGETPPINTNIDDTHGIERENFPLGFACISITVVVFAHPGDTLHQHHFNGVIHSRAYMKLVWHFVVGTCIAAQFWDEKTFNLCDI